MGDTSKYHALTETVYKSIIENFHPGVKQLLQVGKSLQKSLLGVAATSKTFVDCLQVMAQSAQSHEGAAITVGSTLLQVAEVFREINMQLVDTATALQTDLLTPLESKQESEAKRMQVQVRKYQAGYKHLADTYLKSRNELNKLQKKSKNITATKEFKLTNDVRENFARFEDYQSQSFRHVLLEEKTRYCFLLDHLCAYIRTSSSYHCKAHELLTAHLSDWAAVCKNAQTLPEAFAQLNNTKLETTNGHGHHQAPANGHSSVTNGNGATPTHHVTSSVSMPNGLHKASSNDNLLSGSSSEINGKPGKKPVADAQNGHVTNGNAPSHVSSSGQQQMRLVVKATFAYTGTDKSQVSFSENDILHVMSEAQGWYYGQNLRTNRLGWFPCTFVAEIPGLNRSSSAKQLPRVRSLGSLNDLGPSRSGGDDARNVAGDSDTSPRHRDADAVQTTPGTSMSLSRDHNGHPHNMDTHTIPHQHPRSSQRVKGRGGGGPGKSVGWQLIKGKSQIAEHSIDGSSDDLRDRLQPAKSMPDLFANGQLTLPPDEPPTLPPSRPPPRAGTGKPSALEMSGGAFEAGNGDSSTLARQNNRRMSTADDGCEGQASRRMSTFSQTGMQLPVTTWTPASPDLNLPTRLPRTPVSMHDDPDYVSKKLIMQAYQNEGMRRAESEMFVLGAGGEQQQQAEYVSRMLLAAHSLQDRAREQENLSKAMIVAALEAQNMGGAGTGAGSGGGKDPDYMSKAMLSAAKDPDYVSKAMLFAAQANLGEDWTARLAAMTAAGKDPAYMTRAALLALQMSATSNSAQGGKETDYMSKAMLAAQLAAVAGGNKDPDTWSLSRIRQQNHDRMTPPRLVMPEPGHAHFQSTDDLPLPSPPPHTPPPVEFHHPDPDYVSRKLRHANHNEAPPPPPPHSHLHAPNSSG